MSADGPQDDGPMAEGGVAPPDGSLGSVRSPRFMQWIAFFVCSIVVLGSSVSVIENQEGTNGRNVSQQMDGWTVACSAITFIMTFIVVVLHLFPATTLYIVGTRQEGALIALLLLFWCVLVSVISDSQRGLAVNAEGNVSNGNLYYFSWAGLICAILLLVSYLKSSLGVDLAGEVKTRSARLPAWTALLAFSLVTMGAAANAVDNHCIVDASDYRGSTYCYRSRLGIAFGVISGAISVCLVGIKLTTSKAPFLVEALLSLALFLCWVIAVVYITAKRGPGSGLNNMYYFTWACFVSSGLLLSSCVEQYFEAPDDGLENGPTAPRNVVGQIKSPPPPTMNDIPVEHLDDDRL